MITAAERAAEQHAFWSSGKPLSRWHFCLAALAIARAWPMPVTARRAVVKQARIVAANRLAALRLRQAALRVLVAQEESGCKLAIAD
jgi:hypothetical protein